MHACRDDRAVGLPWLLAQPAADLRPIREFDLVTNILEAQVSARGGYLIVMLHGDREKVEQGLAWLSTQGAQIRILSEMEADASEA